MKSKRMLAALVLAVFSLIASACGGGSDLEELNVAYFLEWPTPNQFEQANGTYDDELGLKVNWVQFGTGVEMSAAMASGAIDIAFSQGLVPFVNAVSSGQDLKIVDIAVSYAENDNCVARTDLGITRENATELNGTTVAVPLGTVAHYKMLKSLQYMGVDTDSFRIVNLDPAEGAAALQGGDVDLACGWGGGLNRMKEAGNILMTGAEMEDEIGLKVFDVTSVRTDFAEENGDVVTDFLRITAEANAAYAANPGERIPALVAESGMDEEGVLGSLATFSFPTVDEQKGDSWLGRDVPKFMNEVADLFVAEGALESKLDDYAATIDTSFLG
ncbi:MAG: taurine transport system substrate-binding protein [Verrucomicrobiales bacterium]|jgi:taurine transport system substrate-binding protein